MKKVTVVNFLAEFAENSSKSAKNADFFEKSWKFKFPQKSKYCSKMHEIEVWSTQRDVFSFRIARTHLRAIWRSNFDAYGDLGESMWEKPKFWFSNARALPRAHYGARAWSPSDEEFYFLHSINLHQVDWTQSFRCRSVFSKKKPNGLACVVCVWLPIITAIKRTQT